MRVKPVSSKVVVQRHRLHWKLNIKEEDSQIGFPDELSGCFQGYIFIKRAIRGDGWVMNPVGNVGDEKVGITMIWSPPEDKKLCMICGFSIGKTADLPDVDIDDENSYKVKWKFGFLDNLEDDLYMGTKKDGILLEGNNILKDLTVGNKFSVKAEILILPTTTVDREYNQANSTLTYLGNMRSIEMGDKNCDLKIYCSGKEFNVHKVIICGRSEVFKNALGHKTLESTSNVYNLEDTTAEACEEMLKFIYKGEVGDISKCVYDLIQLSDMYQLKELKAACLDSMMDNLKISNCIFTFVYVNKFAAESRTREDILMFMTCKVMKVIVDENWIMFLKQYAVLATDIVKSIGKDRKFQHSCKFC